MTDRAIEERIGARAVRASMSSPAPLRPNAPGRRSLRVFFAVALGTTWALQLPALLAQRGVIAGPAERFLLPAALAGFGPLLAVAVAMRFEARPATRAETWRAAFGAFRRPVATGRLHLVALATFPVLHLLGAGIYNVVAGAPRIPWVYLPDNAQQIAAMLLVPLAEEPAWRGYALPRLERDHGLPRASLILGLVWALWHATMFLLSGVGASPVTFGLASANIVAGSVVFAWLYARSRGSLSVALVAHAGAHLSNPSHALPDDIAPFAVYTASVAVFAAALVFLDRRAFGGPVRTEPAP